MTPAARIRSLLTQIYGEETAASLTERIIARFPEAQHRTRRPFAGSDSILITYADTLRREGEKPLATLSEFVDSRIPEISHIHLLPFFPSSGDGGFAVVDFHRVEPSLGGWDDITVLANKRRLMVDLVLNHMSVESVWFRRFLEGDPHYEEWFHRVDPATDLSTVFRPRTHPLVTDFPTTGDRVGVWTTFSPEQADLNFAHPPVLEEMIGVMMSYVERGASVIRLDAVGYLWKEAGTPCLHHPKTHLVVRLLRAVLDHAAPHVALVTETNVPHTDNVSYFGSGEDEAQMVYNFSLPPLVLDAFLREDTTVLTRWAGDLDQPGAGTFLNFLASHDGIGLTPVHGLLPPEVIDHMAAMTDAVGGIWSGRTAADGSVRPYEINMSFIDALGMRAGIDDDHVIARFLAAVSIQMSLRGVPGVYVHSALGTRSWWEGPQITGQARSINRPWLDAEQVNKELDDGDSPRGVVLEGHRRMLAARTRTGAFDPSGDQEAQPIHGGAFSLIRSGSHGEVWCVTNVTSDHIEVEPPPGWGSRRRSTIDGSVEGGVVHLPPYAYDWYER